MNPIKAFGKFLDQPILISKFDKNMPKILLGATVAKIGHDVFVLSVQNKNKSKEEKINSNKKLFANSFVLLGSVLSALLAPKIASKITNRTTILKPDKAAKRATLLVDEFLNSNKQNAKTKFVLQKAKNNILSFEEINVLYNSLNKTEDGRMFFNKLIPEPENIKAKDIFSEIGYLSIYGAIPVLGGVTSGIAADVASKEDLKKKLPDKISEGLYQYLANIFLCNVGAGAALGILEKMKINSKAIRALGMIAGIAITGVIFGSKIANFISRKILNPIISPKKEIKERKPEALDLFMHTDDIATVSVLSGLKWIEPALPILYSVSGYKAGIGYRN